jgi:hypothetical protein
MQRREFFVMCRARRYIFVSSAAEKPFLYRRIREPAAEISAKPQQNRPDMPAAGFRHET